MRKTFVTRKALRRREKEGNENQRQGRNRSENVGDQNEKIDRPYETLAREGCVPLKMVVDDIGDEKGARDGNGREHELHM